MGLVDVSDRHGDPLVRAAGAAGSHGASVILVGWEEDGQLAACLSLVRAGPDQLELRQLAVTDSARRAEIGRQAVEAVAQAATAARLVVHGDPTDGIWLQASGFRPAEPLPDGRYRYLRHLDATPADPPDVASISLTELEDAIRGGWGPDTSATPDQWSPRRPSRGQCDVTSLVVRDLLGGEIVIANVIRDGKKIERHAWNRLPSGLSLDLTRDQFRSGEQLGPPAIGEPANLGRLSERHALLSRRVHRYLNTQTGH